MGLRVYRAEISVPFTEKSVPSACFYANPMEIVKRTAPAMLAALILLYFIA